MLLEFVLVNVLSRFKRFTASLEVAHGVGWEVLKRRNLAKIRFEVQILTSMKSHVRLNCTSIYKYQAALVTRGGLTSAGLLRWPLLMDFATVTKKLADPLERFRASLDVAVGEAWEV